MKLQIWEHEIWSKEALLEKVKFFAEKFDVSLEVAMQLMILEELSTVREYMESME